MRSMTGYGKGTWTDGGKTLTIELKSVNNRYLDINSRLPKSFVACEDPIRREVASQVRRGSVEVLFFYENKSQESKAVTVDLPLARAYYAAAKKLRDEFLLDGDFGTTALLRSPEVLRVESERDDPQALTEAVVHCVREALTGLNAMRDVEGKSIQADLTRLIANIVSALESVVTRAPKVVEEYRVKLRQRIEEALQGVAVDEARLVNEVAFFADKADINEEISRLSSHIAQFLACMDSGEPQGRKLDFISQEMNREINTMGSKSNDTELTNYVVLMKNELEKIKEQIRNVE